MKTRTLKSTAYIFLSVLFFSLATTSCSKSGDAPGGGNHNIPIQDYGTHNIDAKLQGTWLWTSGSDIGYNDENGTWQGGGYGFANRLEVDAKGNGTLYSYVYSDLGGGNRLEVDIYYTGYYEMDADGNLAFYSMGGRYVSSSGTDRALSGNEIYNPQTGTGRVLLYPNIKFKTINSKPCFTSTSDVEEFFWKQ